jgi:fatty-acyl-CoA synthase
MTGNYAAHALDLFASYGDAEALVAPDGRRFTYTRLHGRIRDTAAALWHHGIRPGTTMVVLATNSPESLFVQLAAHLMGCRTVYPVYNTPWVFLRDVPEFVEADAIVYEVAGTGSIGPALVEHAQPRLALCIGSGGLGPDLVDPPSVSTPPFAPSDITTPPVCLYQTSGTTATPKLLVHGNRYFAAIRHAADFYRPPGGRIRHLYTSSTYHAGGQSGALMTWVDGGRLVMQTFSVPTLLDTIERERMTSILLSPHLLYRVLDDPRIEHADLSSLHAATIAGGPASPARLAEAATYFGAALNVIYGMSEIPMISVLRDAGGDPRRSTSCGQVWKTSRAEIRDAAGNPLPAGGTGEIWTTGDRLTEGYWKRPDLNEANLVDGWLRTGDVGRFDDDGYLYIVDRVSDMVMTDVAANIVYCRPLEDVLTGHPEVRDAAVIGVPDDAFGEVVYAYVVPAPGATVSADELRRLVVDRLNAQWSPREVEFIDTLPLTDAGKVDKKALRARYLAGVQ